MVSRCHPLNLQAILNSSLMQVRHDHKQLLNRPHQLVVDLGNKPPKGNPDLSLRPMLKQQANLSREHRHVSPRRNLSLVNQVFKVLGKVIKSKLEITRLSSHNLSRPNQEKEPMKNQRAMSFSCLTKICSN